MINIQDEIITSGLYKTFRVDELLFVDYHCFVDEDHSEVWAHDNYLAMALSGEKKWKTPTNEVKIGSGEALFVKKGANTVFNYIDQPFVVLFVFIPDKFIRQVILKHSDLWYNGLGKASFDNSLIPVFMNRLLGSFVQSLLALFSQETVFSKNILKLKMEELVLNILTQPGNEPLKHHFLNLARQQKVDLEDVMKSNFNRPLSMNDFARLSARSLSTFRRDFQELFGETPGKWLTKKRLEYSRFLLETTDQTLSEVMDNSGFKNQSHFIKAFKIEFGTPPNKYRSLAAAIS